MSNLCGIYSITNMINGKRIIGQSKNIKRRWRDHKYFLRKNGHVNPYLQNAWNKYGEQNFKFKVILLCSIEKLDKAEIKIIKKYNSSNKKFGYNLKEGGNRPKMSEETKAKLRKAWQNRPSTTEETKERMRKAQTGRRHSEETKQKMKKAQKGKNNPMFGKQHSQETKQKMSKDRRGKQNVMFGKNHSEEAKQKMSNSSIGQIPWNKGKTNVYTEETKQKMRQTKIGSIPWNKGKHCSEKTKEKIRKALLGKRLSQETKEKMREAWVKRKLNFCV